MENLYEVDLASIWANERQLFLDQKSDLRFASKFWNEIQIFIVHNSKPEISFEDLDKDTDHYRRTFNMFRSATSDLNQLFQNEYFYNNKGYYNCNTDLFVARSYDNFHYWFILKLRQLEHNIFDIPKFLNFQLKYNFKKDINVFREFLNLLLQQYNQNFLRSGTMKVIEDWIAQNTINSDSFIINKKLLNNRKSLYQILNGLKEHLFISKSISIDDLENTFSGRKVKNKIVWCGANVELKYFVKKLYSTEIVTGPKDKWITTVSCFSKPNEDAFTTDQLRNANGLKDERKIIIDSILKHSAVNKN